VTHSGLTRFIIQIEAQKIFKSIAAKSLAKNGRKTFLILFELIPTLEAQFTLL
jgi:hypothetical protein